MGLGVFARLGRLSGAARSLNITPSAVGHRIRGLEQDLGRDLLERTPGGLRLTEAGRRYRVDVEDAFARLARATEELVGSDPSRPLTISLTSEIGMRWLMPRFHRFMERHPDIETTIHSTYRMADLAAGEADLALRHGEGRWPGLRAEPILHFSVTPLCAPQVAERLRGLAPPAALAASTLIRDVSDQNDDWDAWMAAAGAAAAVPLRLLRFEDHSMAVRGAVGGQGLVLGYSPAMWTPKSLPAPWCGPSTSPCRATAATTSSIPRTGCPIQGSAPSATGPSRSARRDAATIRPHGPDPPSAFPARPRGIPCCVRRNSLPAG